MDLLDHHSQCLTEEALADFFLKARVRVPKAQHLVAVVSLALVVALPSGSYLGKTVFVKSDLLLLFSGQIPGAGIEVGHHLSSRTRSALHSHHFPKTIYLLRKKFIHHSDLVRSL
jgi:hypothetical protein